MNYRQKKPCAGCPFRVNAVPGWLGDYTPEEVIQHLLQEIPFVCHTQVENGPGYDDPNWLAWAEENADHCAGGLIMQRRMCKLPRDREHGAAVKAVDPKTKILFPPQVFIAYHNAHKRGKDESSD